MKKALLFGIALFFMVMLSEQTIQTTRATPVATLFSDGFESESFSVWETVDGAWDTKDNSTNAHSGNVRAEAKGPEAVDAILRGKVATTDHENITFSYWYKINKTFESEDEDQIVVEWSTDGDIWNRLISYAGSEKTEWIEAAHALPAEAANAAELRFRFSATLDAGSDVFWLDDVLVSGEEISDESIGSIAGKKFEDRDGDGEDEEDAGIAGWTINLYRDGESEEPDFDNPIVASTSSDGTYAFSDLALGEYYICEELQSGWTQTFPNDDEYECPDGTQGYETVIDEENLTFLNKDFGNFKYGSISGYKFNDRNGNTQWDEDESALSDWTINLEEVESERAIETTTTNAEGLYLFSSLSFGTYRVYETIASGSAWIQTYPILPAYHEISVTSSAQAEQINFGNKMTPTPTPTPATTPTPPSGGGGGGGGGEIGVPINTPTPSQTPISTPQGEVAGVATGDETPTPTATPKQKLVIEGSQTPTPTPTPAMATETPAQSSPPPLQSSSNTGKDIGAIGTFFTFGGLNRFLAFLIWLVILGVIIFFWSRARKI